MTILHKSSFNSTEQGWLFGSAFFSVGKFSYTTIFTCLFASFVLQRLTYTEAIEVLQKAVKEDGVVRLPTDVRLHDLDSIRKGLPDQLSVQLYDYIDSTNSAMLRRHEVRRHEVRRHSQAGAANHLIYPLINIFDTA